ncbi:MAG: class I tRNA ligase family protein, partial [Chitinophagaceae bacterium]|nr:class I tRNA ligase family protein [Chitinophagaceae bacterium]
MSKQLGNSPDLLGLIDKYGADAVRFGILISSPAGNDLLWDEASNEQGRNFNNKLWNALKLVKMWEGRQPAANSPQSAVGIQQSTVGSQQSSGNFAIEWFENRLNEVKAELENLYKDFRLSEALKTVYSLIWDDFCSWYLEWVKPGFEQPIEKDVYQKTVYFFEELMQLLHPFMPFITEEIYHQLKERKKGDDLTVRQQAQVSGHQPGVLEQGKLLKELITGLRDIRIKQQIKPKESIRLFIQTQQQNIYPPIQSILCKQVNAEHLTFVNEAEPGTISSVIGKDKFYLLTEQPVNTENQKEELQKELNYLKGFLVSVEKKLGNERFVQNAKPEVIEVERKKKSDAEAKIKAIEESLTNLN